MGMTRMKALKSGVATGQGGIYVFGHESTDGAARWPQVDERDVAELERLEFGEAMSKAQIGQVEQDLDEASGDAALAVVIAAERLRETARIEKPMEEVRGATSSQSRDNTNYAPAQNVAGDVVGSSESGNTPAPLAGTPAGETAGTQQVTGVPMAPADEGKTADGQAEHEQKAPKGAAAKPAAPRQPKLVRKAGEKQG